MGLFDFFPYTSGHTLNLDWIIKTVKKLGGDFRIFKDEVNAKVATIPEEVSAEVAKGLPAEVAKITPESINAAPGGFGLGKTIGKVVTDANSATNNGWYTIYNNGTNLPGSSYGGQMLVKAFPSNIVQSLFYTGHGGGECRRICIDGVWGEWEYVTPPLYAGIEYRTTERYNGLAVYTKLLDCGAVVNQKAVNHGAGNGLIRMSAVASGILSTTIYPADNDWGWFVSADQTAVRMTCGSGIENNASWKVQIWYVKN